MIKFQTPYGGKKKISEPDSLEKGFDYVTFLLSLRLRTVGEVREKMSQRGFTERVVDEVVKDFTERKFLNDHRYAEVFLENLKKYKHYGFFGIKKKMMEKKLPSVLIERVLEEGLPVEEELAIAERLLKKEKLLKPELSLSEKQKAARRLQARGFRSEVVARLVF